MSQPSLFSLPVEDEGPEEERKTSRRRGAPRVNRPDRRQMRLLPASLDSLVPEDHEVRAVWAFIERLDLRGLYEQVQAVEGAAGRPASDPRVLVALWVYATIEGVGSARALERLCQEHVAFRWICGGVGVNHVMLSIFRSTQAQVLDQLLTQSVALLRHKGLIELKRVAQDGMRVRACAGAASFRRAKSLKKCLRAAKARVARLREELETDPEAAARRQEARRLRAAEARMQRVQEALKLLPEIAEKKPKSKRGEARASTTDPDARIMKMADGGFRPAFNVQIAADTATQVIVGVNVTNKGSDLGEMKPMVEQLEARHGEAPEEMLVDGGFVKLADIEAVAQAPHGCKVYAPPPKHTKSTRPLDEPRPHDSDAIREWRERMGTDEAKDIYKKRAATVECVNAQARNRGLQRFLVRGLPRVKAVVLIFALAHNVARAFGMTG